MRKFTQVFLHPYPFNTKANPKNLGTVLFLRAWGIRKLFYNLRILMFLLEMCVCLHMVEDRKFLVF